MANVLVTGGAGFIGSNLVDSLIRQGHTVKVWDSLVTGRKDNVHKDARFYNIDVADISPTHHTGEKYDVIYHMAALARIQPSFESPSQTFDANVRGTTRVLELARLHKAKVVYAGSSSFYHDVYANPYTFTKWQGEELCKMYNKIYGVSTTIARFFNVYGARQIYEGPYATVMGIFGNQKLNDKPLTVTGDGLQRRDFTAVEDIVEGLMLLGEKEWDAEIFNFGSGQNYSILEIANMFNHPIEFIPKRPGEAQDTLADIQKTTEVLGWYPKKSRELEHYIGYFNMDIEVLRSLRTGAN